MRQDMKMKYYVKLVITQYDTPYMHLCLFLVFLHTLFFNMKKKDEIFLERQLMTNVSKEEMLYVTWSVMD